MKSARWSIVALIALAMLLMPVTRTSAQDATPEGTPAPACMAPELPPGTPTTEASPESEVEIAMAAEDAAPVKEGPASRNIAASGEAALDNIVLCLNDGNYAGVAALMTPNMLAYIAGSENPYDLVAAFEAEPPAPGEILSVTDPVIDTNNRIGLTVVYSGITAGPGIQPAEKWYFVRDGDNLLLDETRPTTLPVDLYPDATIVHVQMVDYAFALDMNTVPAGPVIFSFSNTSYSGDPHVGVTVTLTEGITAEQLIEADMLPEDQITGFVNAMFLEPGMVGEYYVEDMAPGTYTLVCDVTTPDGTPHWMLGMVAQFTVE